MYCVVKLPVPRKSILMTTFAMAIDTSKVLCCILYLSVVVLIGVEDPLAKNY